MPDRDATDPVTVDSLREARTSREIDPDEARRIGGAIGDFMVAAGHPLTCNGGNPDWRSHHDHEVRMQIGEQGLVCPECGRVQELPTDVAARYSGGEVR